jgi:hypothetical protein
MISFLPKEMLNIIFQYLDLDIQWELRKQPKWPKKWE